MSNINTKINIFGGQLAASISSFVIRLLNISFDNTTNIAMKAVIKLPNTANHIHSNINKLGFFRNP